MLTKKDIQAAHNRLGAAGMSPVKVSKDAAKALNSATMAAKSILAQRKKLDNAGRQNEPLIVLAGEVHNQPLHYLHHMHVLKQLIDEEPHTRVAIELPHDYIKKAFKESAAPTATKHTPPSALTDNNYKDEVLLEIGRSTRDTAPYTRNIFFNFCLDNDIKIKFVDTSRAQPRTPKDRKKVDITDPETTKSFQTCLGAPYPGLTLISPKGMYVRNHHIVKTATKFAKDSHARILFQQCGAMHVAGDKTVNMPYSQSLHHLFKQAGAPLTAYYLAFRDYYMFAAMPSSPLSAQDLINTGPLPFQSASYKETLTYEDATSENDDDIRNHNLNSHDKEAAYTNTALAATNLEQYGLTSRAYFNKKTHNRDYIKNKFDTWRQQLDNKPPSSPNPGL